MEDALGDLSEENQDKLAGYDILEMDVRFAARHLCLFLTRYIGRLPEGAERDLRQILAGYLLSHLHPTDRAWWEESISKAVWEESIRKGAGETQP